MAEDSRQFNFWYAVHNTKIVHAPSRALETFGETRVNYHLVAELEDDPHKVRIREGRLEAHKPAIITPEAYVDSQLEGFGAQAKEYLDFLKQHEQEIRILQYGYCLSQESISEQVVTGSVDEVVDRVVRGVKDGNDPFATVIKGVDNPWDVCLVHFFWLHANASAPVNVREFERVRQATLEDATPPAVRSDVERAFARAERDPSLVRELGAFLQKQGVFERYQDRFFQLVKRGQ